MKTADEITNLKCLWLDDPHWDIENTEGFEAHRDELREYRRIVEAEREWEQRKRLDAKAGNLGCPGNLKLAAYVDRLESRLDKLEDSQKL